MSEYRGKSMTKSQRLGVHLVLLLGATPERNFFACALRSPESGRPHALHGNNKLFKLKCRQCHLKATVSIKVTGILQILTLEAQKKEEKRNTYLCFHRVYSFHFIFLLKKTLLNFKMEIYFSLKKLFEL